MLKGSYRNEWSRHFGGNGGRSIDEDKLV